MNEKADSRYKTFIDLTSKAQEKARGERDREALADMNQGLQQMEFSALPEQMAQAIQNAGWNDLLPVQKQAIPYLLAKKDMIVQSRTGTGKTGSFLLPLFSMLDISVKAVQALILTPTRELARQISEEFHRMKSGSSSLQFNVALVYGGVRYGPQIRSLKQGAHLVIGTPGRILDLLEQRHLSLEHLEVFIIDEADEMLSMGFYPSMQQLKRYLTNQRNSFMFSATIPPKVRWLADQFLEDPGFLSLSEGGVGVDEIDHHYYVVDQMQKDRILVRVIELENPDSAIIFANTKREVEYLSTFLTNYGHDVRAISGDLTQAAREKVMRRVRKGAVRFLVATDVAARGIDISDLSHVIMYDVPQDPEYYIHRSGRTARAGKTGTAIVLATHSDERLLLRIKRNFGIDMEKRPVPSEQDVERKVTERITIVLEDRMRLKSNLQKERMQRFIPLVEELSKEEPELIALMLDDLYHQMIHRVENEGGQTEQRQGGAKTKGPKSDD